MSVAKILWTVTVNRDRSTVTVELGGKLDYLVEVEIRGNPSADGELEPVAAGLNVRRWPDEEGNYRGVAPREIQRLPLTRIRDAALVAWRSSDDEYPGDAVDRLLAPRGRPERGKATSFYREIAAAYRGFKSRGLSPAKEIAKRKRVEENTVYTWIHRARQLGYLEKPVTTRRKGRKK